MNTIPSPSWTITVTGPRGGKAKTLKANTPTHARRLVEDYTNERTGYSAVCSPALTEVSRG